MIPNYNTNDPLGWCGDAKRGAALGRPTIQEESESYTGDIFAQRIKLDVQGYDKNGTYFGVGMPLYWIANEALTIDYMLRAPDRAGAIADALHRYPNAQFKHKQRATKVKDKTLNIRMSAEDMQRLQELAKHLKLSRSEVLRMLIKERHDRLMWNRRKQAKESTT